MVQLARYIPGRRSILGGLTGGLAVVLVVGVSLQGVGRWLIVTDPLEPSPVAVVLGGEVPFRAREAALLFREKWVARVWLTRGGGKSRDGVAGGLGTWPRDYTLQNIEVLERLGVPGSAIRILDHRSRNTASELKIVAKALRREGIDRVIIVTSKAHTRRVRATWRVLVGTLPRVIIRPAGEDPYEPIRWWRRTRDTKVVSHEVLGLLNVWARFPVRSGGP
jgi:uncharacterized SAM-binding protein YcdF (DUF218 family)